LRANSTAQGQLQSEHERNKQHVQSRKEDNLQNMSNENNNNNNENATVRS
jgi:hypothetical protein